jgi:Cleft lip and palate transmembrane protein 1 (CLPTM1)
LPCIFLARRHLSSVAPLPLSSRRSIFDMLAFKNDVAFWRRRRSLEGLSVRSIAVNTFIQCVVALYLWDNDTSMLVLLSTTVGVAIELWKVNAHVCVCSRAIFTTVCSARTLCAARTRCAAVTNSS